MRGLSSFDGFNTITTATNGRRILADFPDMKTWMLEAAGCCGRVVR
jgi:hypothetical protein